MFINDTFKKATLTLSLAAAGPIATAPLSVDIASSFSVTGTAANLALTLPNPTNAQAGDVVHVSNAAANANTFTINGYTIKPSEFGEFVWNGTSWLNMDGGRNTGASVSVATVSAGNFLVTHNLVMPTGTFSQVVYRAYDSAGSEVLFKRNKAADTANALGFSSPVAITGNLPIVFDFTPLA